MFDAELEEMKTRIDMRAYAVAQGYTLDRKESWRGSAVMRHPRGDKIIIKRDIDDHYVFFSVHSGASGTIIDLVQSLQRLSLGAVRKELRPWIGMSPVPVPTFEPLMKTAKDRIRVEGEFSRMEIALTHAYLENERHIPAELLASKRIAGRVCRDARGNAVFPHYDADELCGYEIKNKNFTGFASGGTKGLWLSHEESNDRRLVLAESAIDALSHALLFPDEKTRYASIGGQPTSTQVELIRAAAARMPSDGEIVAAMDADSAGARLSEVVRQAVEMTGRADLRFSIQRPAGFKDWNDQLRARPTTPLPFRLEEPSVA